MGPLGDPARFRSAVVLGRPSLAGDRLEPIGPAVLPKACWASPAVADRIDDDNQNSCHWAEKSLSAPHDDALFNTRLPEHGSPMICAGSTICAHWQGDANAIGKRGRRPDAALAPIRVMFEDVSPRI